MIKLNLLPPEIRSDIEYSKKNARLYQHLIKSIAGLFVVGAFMGVVGYFVWGNETLAQDSREDAYSQASRFLPVENKAKDFYSRLSLIQKLRDDRYDWTRIFSEIAKSTSTNVRLISFDFTNAATDRVALNGFALTNADVGAFRELLSKSILFKFVDIESMTAGTDPSSTSRTGVNFKITLSLNVSEAKR